MENQQNSSNLINLDPVANASNNALAKLISKDKKDEFESRKSLLGLHLNKKRPRTGTNTDKFGLARKNLGRGLTTLAAYGDISKVNKELGKAKRETFKKIKSSFARARAAQRESVESYESFLTKTAREFNLDTENYKTLVELPKNELVSVSMKKLHGSFSKRTKFEVSADRDENLIVLSNNYKSVYGMFFDCMQKHPIYKANLNNGLSSFEDISIKNVDIIMYFDNDDDFLNAINLRTKFANSADPERDAFTLLKCDAIAEIAPNLEVMKYKDVYKLPVDGAVFNYRNIVVRSMQKGDQDFYTTSTASTLPDSALYDINSKKSLVEGLELFQGPEGKNEAKLNMLTLTDIRVGEQLGFEKAEDGWKRKAGFEDKFLPAIKISVSPDAYGNSAALLGCIYPTGKVKTFYNFHCETTSSDFATQVNVSTRSLTQSLVWGNRKYVSNEFDAFWSYIFESPKAAIDTESWEFVQRPLLIAFNRLALLRKYLRLTESARQAIRTEFRKYTDYTTKVLTRVDIVEQWENSRMKLERVISKASLYRELIRKDPDLRTFFDGIKPLIKAIASKMIGPAKDHVYWIAEKSGALEFSAFTDVEDYNVNVDSMQFFIDGCVNLVNSPIDANEIKLIKHFKAKGFNTKIASNLETFYNTFKYSVIRKLDYDQILGYSHFENFIRECSSRKAYIESKLNQSRSLSFGDYDEDRDRLLEMQTNMTKQISAWDELLKIATEKYEEALEAKNGIVSALKPQNPKTPQLNLSN